MLAIAVFLCAVITVGSVLAFDELIPAPGVFGPVDDPMWDGADDTTVRWSALPTVIL